MARTREKTSSTMFSPLSDIAPCLSSVTEQAMNKIITKISNHVRNIDKTEPELLGSHPRHLGEVLLMKQSDYVVIHVIWLFKGPFIVIL